MIKQLHISGVRNLAPASMSFTQGINCFYGVNGSGKTSILEAIYILGLGRSFRDRLLQPVLNQQGSDLLLVADLLHGGTLGFEYQKLGKRRIRYQGENIDSSAELARLLPIQCLNQQMYDVLQGSAKLRRKLLDWGVFHVEQHFLTDWRAYSLVLKQRNAQLRAQVFKVKQKTSSAQQTSLKANQQILKEEDWAIWEKPLVKYAEAVQGHRQAYLDRLLPCFKECLMSFMPALVEDIELKLHSGWRFGASYADVLVEHRRRDLTQGFTGRGPHRAEMHFLYQGVPAQQYLSRGQQKMLVTAFKIAQSVLHKKTHQKPTIFLLDDLSAELDMTHRMALCRWLESLKCQTFITSIDDLALQGCWSKRAELNVFHVEQGRLYRGDNSL